MLLNFKQAPVFRSGITLYIWQAWIPFSVCFVICTGAIDDILYAQLTSLDFPGQKRTRVELGRPRDEKQVGHPILLHPHCSKSPAKLAAGTWFLFGLPSPICHLWAGLLLSGT